MKHNTCIAIVLLLASTASAAGPANAKSPLAINLGGISDWSTELVFVDAFKQSRKWISQAEGKGWGKGPALDVTADGWVRSLKPGQRAETILLGVDEHKPAGLYVCLYDGKGELQFRGDGKVKQSAPGRIVVDVKPRNAIFLSIVKTDPSDPIRNIRFIMPGFEKTCDKQPFNPKFLKRWASFRAIRFMDWQHTNGSPLVKWSDRSTPNRSNQSGPKGVAIEYMIALANTQKADPWFCMPHLADDDFIRRYAQLVKKTLDPKLKIYVEYSNECWNGQFQQARYCGQKGKELKLSSNAFQAQLFYYSKRSVEVFKIWVDVFGSTDRLVRVIASQSANPWVSKQVTGFQDALKHADALGIAPYFGNRLGSPKTQNEVAKKTVDEVLDACRKAIARNRDILAKQAKVASDAGLDLIAYEGGQHLVGHGGAENNKALEKLFHAANRDPRMKGLYLEDLAGWKQAGGKLFAVFSSTGRYSKWGSWGVLESGDQDPATAPKYQALLEFIAKNSIWWK